MKQIMPGATIPPSPSSDIQMPKLKGTSRGETTTDVTEASVAADTHIRSSKDIIYETPKREPVRKDEDENDDDYDDEFLKDDAKKFSRENLGAVASSYLTFTQGGFLTRNTVCVRMVIYLNLGVPRC